MSANNGWLHATWSSGNYLRKMVTVNGNIHLVKMKAIKNDEWFEFYVSHTPLICNIITSHARANETLSRKSQPGSYWNWRQPIKWKKEKEEEMTGNVKSVSSMWSDIDERSLLVGLNLKERQTHTHTNRSKKLLKIILYSSAYSYMLICIWADDKSREKKSGKKMVRWRFGFIILIVKCCVPL